MGHQVSFYLLPVDTLALEERLRRLGEWRGLHNRSETSEPRILTTLDFEEEGKPWLFLHLARAVDLENIITKYVPEQRYWTLNVQASPVIEFNRCFFDGKILRRGRMYYVDGLF